MNPPEAPVPAVSISGVPPAVTSQTAAYFEAASAGRLVVERCADCACEIFPPRGVCRKCRGRNLEVAEVHGPAVVHSWTVNHQPWMPGMDVPFALALVEFPEHPGVRIPGRIAGDLDRLEVGVAVEVGFVPGPGDLPVVCFTLGEAQ